MKAVLQPQATGGSSVDLPQIVLIFSAGIIVGIFLHPLARLCNSAGINRLLDAIAGMVAAPFNLLARLLRKKAAYRKAEQGITKEAAKPVDPREQQLSDTSQTIRSILIGLAAAIQRTDQAASNSTLALGEVRDSIDRMHLPPDLSEVNIQLLREIDRVISSNAALKRELASSQEILATQRQQIESLKTAVRIDGLTQLANRAYFDEKITEMIALRERYNDPFSLLMIDVDNFKEINDTHGHQGGDRILKGISFKIKSTLRESDFVARFGGDEFAVIVIKAAADIAWKLCSNVRESRFLLDGTNVSTTLSIGVAEVAMGEAAESLLKRADQALYRVKEQGRNGVAIADPPQAEQMSADAPL
jgi:diguanylate cyclase